MKFISFHETVQKIQKGVKRAWQMRFFKLKELSLSFDIERKILIQYYSEKAKKKNAKAKQMLQSLHQMKLSTKI
jgi:DNA integrity scanning protein DisA with diadenylate cyclase activity